MFAGDRWPSSIPAALGSEQHHCVSSKMSCSHWGPPRPCGWLARTLLLPEEVEVGWARCSSPFLRTRSVKLGSKATASVELPPSCGDLIWLQPMVQLWRRTSRAPDWDLAGDPLCGLQVWKCRGRVLPVCRHVIFASGFPGRLVETEVVRGPW